MRFTILLLLASLCFYNPLHAQVSTDSNSEVIGFNNTISNFVVPAGNNRVLIVSLYGDAVFSIPTAVNYGTTPMVKATDVDASFDVSLWYLVLGSGVALAPADIIANTSARGIAAVSFQNVDQTTVFANPQSDSGDASSSSLSVPTSSINNLIIDSFHSNSGTVHVATHTKIGSDGGISMGKAEGTGGNVTVEWSEPSSSTADYSHLAMELIGLEVIGTTNDVPTLSQWGLIILALLLMTAGTLYLVQPMVDVNRNS